MPQVIINEGEKGDNFYIVQTGEFAVFLKKLPGKCVKTYSAGESFGELALLYNSPRAATVKCTASGTLWALDRTTFRAILTDSKQANDSGMLDFLKTIALFASLTHEQVTPCNVA